VQLGFQGGEAVRRDLVADVVHRRQSDNRFDSTRIEATIDGMVAAAITLWLLFSLWVMAPIVGIPGRLERTAAWLLAAELVALLAWSYGVDACNDPTCAPLARAAGIAARADIPALSAAFLFLTLLRLRRSYRS